MSANRELSDPDHGETSEPPDDEAVRTRADGRPSEEASSDDPKAQARAILEDSEERVAKGARASGSQDPPKPLSE